jgi:hypothetical protein
MLGEGLRKLDHFCDFHVLGPAATSSLPASSIRSAFGVGAQSRLFREVAVGRIVVRAPTRGESAALGGVVASVFDPRPALRTRDRIRCAGEVACWITSVVGKRGSRTDGDVLVAGELPRQRPRCRRAPVCRSFWAGGSGGTGRGEQFLTGCTVGWTAVRSDEAGYRETVGTQPTGDSFG